MISSINVNGEPMLRFGILLVVVLGLAGCTTVVRVGMDLIHQAPPPAARSIEDVAYWEGGDADPEKHRLDLFLPHEEIGPFPMMVFVHGGSFVKGDKDLVVGEVEIYGDLGRYFANRGIGVAVISYRLQPAVQWHEQAADVARAIAWVKKHGEELGADGTLVLAGHSVGAWLVARASLDPLLREPFGLTTDDFAGVVGISGVGYDLADEKTWALDGDYELSERVYRRGEADTDWQRVASILPLIESEAPPFLLIYTRDEWKALARQNQLFHRALLAADLDSTLIRVRGSSHARMVLRLSEPDIVSETVEDFIVRLAGVARSP